MTEEDKINIALADLYGWVDIHQNLGNRYEYCGTDPQGRFRDIPKFWEDAYTFEDLWPKLTDEKKQRFIDELYEIVKREDHPIRYIGPFGACLFATARQRTEAMLRAFDKWKE
jgi:hypothetical protein